MGYEVRKAIDPLPTTPKKKKKRELTALFHETAFFPCPLPPSQSTYSVWKKYFYPYRQLNAPKQDENYSHAKCLQYTISTHRFKKHRKPAMIKALQRGNEGQWQVKCYMDEKKKTINWQLDGFFFSLRIKRLGLMAENGLVKPRHDISLIQLS